MCQASFPYPCVVCWPWATSLLQVQGGQDPPALPVGLPGNAAGATVPTAGGRSRQGVRNSIMGVPGLPRLLHRSSLATRWRHSPDLSQLLRDTAGSLPCPQWGPCPLRCLSCPACSRVPLAVELGQSCPSPRTRSGGEKQAEAMRGAWVWGLAVLKVERRAQGYSPSNAPLMALLCASPRCQEGSEGQGLPLLLLTSSLHLPSGMTIPPS